jgi:hypothetical protein
MIADQCGSDRHRKLNCPEADLPWDEWDETCKRRFRKPTDVYERLFGVRAARETKEVHRLAVRDNREQWPEGCQLCVEPAGAEMGEFYDPKRDDGKRPFSGHVIAHAQCGIDAGLEMA